MEFNLVTNLESCHLAIKSLLESTFILYYSHIPTAVISLLLGTFVLLKNKNNLASRLFFAVSIIFSLWSLFDIILWTSVDSRVTMFFWSVINLMENLVTCLTLYFTYVFIEKRDVALKVKIIFSFLFLPFIFLMPTAYNLTGFNSALCEAEQGPLINYFYFLEIIFFLALVIYLTRKIVKTKGEGKKQVVYFSIGAGLFLSSFSGANIAGSLAAIINPNNPDNWKILQYGLFGMPIFAGFLTYLIVRYKAFNIKLFGFQALTISLVVLIGSQLLFIKNNINFYLTSITLALSAVFGYYLIRSVKEEVKRKEELQEITNKLSIANDKLRKLDTTKSEFISIASHQLRTPLTSIKGYGSLLLEGSYGELNPEQRKVIDNMYQSNTRLINLVDDLLNVSRIESGRMDYKFAKWKLEDICKEIYQTFVPRAKERGLAFNLDIPEQPLPEVTLDGEKIKEVISNLVDNAIKYTPQGSVAISLSQKENSMRVTVSDTGIGIPADEIPFLFAKFSRGKDINRLNTTGTGLGLYVGKNIVEANHGKIWIESDGAGKGSKFVVEFVVE